MFGTIQTSEINKEDVLSSISSTNCEGFEKETLEGGDTTSAFSFPFPFAFSSLAGGFTDLATQITRISNIDSSTTYGNVLST